MLANDNHYLSSTRRWDIDMILDLVDEMMWEDLTDFLTLEEAGLENQDYDTITSAQRAYYRDEE
jgi:hypothetical protein